MEKKLINSYPATRWNDSTPVGNGVLGASVYGAIYDERILINHEDLYNYSNKKEIPDISAELKTVRALMDEGRYKEANDHYTNALKRENYVCGIGKYYPAFDLHMVFELKGAFTDYQRSLDIYNDYSVRFRGKNRPFVLLVTILVGNRAYAVFHIK